MKKSTKTNFSNQLKIGVESIIGNLMALLEKNNLPFNEIYWKNGKDSYLLTVKTDFGTRFARFAPISLLDQESSMTQQINTFLISQLVNKLVTLKKEKL